jgi:hypothetical protein
VLAIFASALGTVALKSGPIAITIAELLTISVQPATSWPRAASKAAVVLPASIRGCDYHTVSKKRAKQQYTRGALS